MENNNIPIELEVKLENNNQQIETELFSNILYAFSPTANVKLLQNGNYLITITDKNGTTTAQIAIPNSQFDLSDRIIKGTNPGTVIQGVITGEAANIASGINSHAEGYGVKVTGSSSHAEGGGTISSGIFAHSEGMDTIASGLASHAEGCGTQAFGKSQHVLGEYNIIDNKENNATIRGIYAEIVGNGTSIDNRSNARTLDWNGNESIAGSLTLGMGTENEVTITAAQLKQLLQLL